MDEVAVAIEKDIAVMSVFDLEEVGDDRVACKSILWSVAGGHVECGLEED